MIPAQPERTGQPPRDQPSLEDADVLWWPDWLDPATANQYFAQLQRRDAIAWRHEEIWLFGRRVLQPRLTAWMGDPGVEYRYSGITMTPLPWSEPVAALRDRAAADSGVVFNSVLINLYRDGRDSVGWHRDNESSLGPRPVIASVSLGATRRFDLRHRQYRDRAIPVRRFESASGSLLVMRGDTQTHWEHQVPKQRAVTTPRINLSFRRVLD